MNAYDMVITMALGSILTKAMLTNDQTIAESVTAIALLVAFQYLLSVASSHWTWFRKLVVAEPAILYADGVFFDKAMQRERVTHTEIEAAIHEKGYANLFDVGAVILGSNSELSVLPRMRDDWSVVRAGTECDSLPFRLHCEYPVEVRCGDGSAMLFVKGPPGREITLRISIKDKASPAEIALLRADGDIVPPAWPNGEELVYRVAADGAFEIRWQARHDAAA